MSRPGGGEGGAGVYIDWCISLKCEVLEISKNKVSTAPEYYYVLQIKKCPTH